MALDAGKVIVGIPPLGATTASVSLTAAADIGLASIGEPMDLAFVDAEIVTAPTVTAAIVTIFRRITTGSDTGVVTVGTMTIPVGTAIGTTVRRTFNSRFNRGDQLRVAVTTTATAGAALLQCHFYPAGDSMSTFTGSELLVVTS